MRRVIGLGGIFFKAKSDIAELKKWYEQHLGIMPSLDEGNSPVWQWRALDEPERIGDTVWSLFNRDTTYLNPSEAEFMINYRVENLVELLKVLREEGVEIVGEMEEFEFGKFCWILDPDGNKIELWEPPVSSGFNGAMAME
ncbi:MAG: VOC family protein [Chitinophagales bacterium]